MQRVLSSTAAQEALAPAVKLWLMDLTRTLQSIIDPICDAHEVPRKEMQLNLNATGSAAIDIDAAAWAGLNAAGTLLGMIISVIGGVLCGGSGVALIASGPLGFAAGLVIGVLASALGWKTLSSQLMKADLPLLLRSIPFEKRLKSDQTRHELKKRLTAALSAEDSDFRKQIIHGFAQSFHRHVQSVAQAAEISIT